MEESKPDYQIRKISLDTKVVIEAVRIRDITTNTGSRKNEAGLRFKDDMRPRKEFRDCMTKLRKHAFALNEMDIKDHKNFSDYTISEVKISGDVLLKQSRCKMIMQKKVEKTGDTINIEVREFVMYDPTNYHDAEKCTAVLEDLFEECWLYAEGHYDEEVHPGHQVPLFVRGALVPEKLETNFTQ